ncbi:hypothetical protein KDA_51940 [Dictyobacter alpinus]|uniref:Uncharacterized protein n=2 Tax=Dictyobacter alpinus TaxID=2014873 RepID=A0A402BEI6_9CHLR|nr:hypothetical protein KDA_51940 [Dictyobacter alpinus]
MSSLVVLRFIRGHGMGAALVTRLVAVKTHNVLLAVVVGWISVLGLRWLQENR